MASLKRLETFLLAQYSNPDQLVFKIKSGFGIHQILYRCCKTTGSQTSTANRVSGCVKNRQCGRTYTTYHEKMTDVNISVELMSDAFQSRFDTAFLLSADSDLTGPIETVRRLLQKRVWLYFHREGHLIR
jgi:uncharacterized LabA/DUF88 family protein